MDDRTVSRNANPVVRALMSYNGDSKETLAPRIDMNVATLYRRLAEKSPAPWKAGELFTIAEHYGVSVLDIYMGRLPEASPPPNTRRKPGSSRVLVGAAA